MRTRCGRCSRAIEAGAYCAGCADAISTNICFELMVKAMMTGLTTAGVALLALASLFLLSGCSATAPGVSAPAGGTAVALEGEVCGRAIKIQLADINDRGAFTARCTFDTVTGIATVEVSTAERGASDAIAAMAAANQALADRLVSLAGNIAGVP